MHIFKNYPCVGALQAPPYLEPYLPRFPALLDHAWYLISRPVQGEY
jgi:hypothetical protein